MHPGLLHRRFLQDLSSSLFSFVLPLLPTTEERAVKEEVRTLIEKLIKTIEPSARLLAFGSSQNSFGLRNSDMDLVVLIDDPSANLEASHLVQMIGDLLQRETNFDVKPLPKARIPILKLTLSPSPALPFGISCDIGIENRLAIENTRLLLTYATIDPARVRTLVLFLKVWAKRRRINSPYRGTLSSYGFTLMVLYFLVHVKQPPVLPNLQRIAPIRPLTEEEVMIQGRNVYFFDDTETIRQEWSSINFETVGELLIDFFRFFSHDFQFNNSVMSLRAGQVTKESKGWVNDIDVGGINEMARDRNRLCIEDPFETSYNVARTVTKDGLYTLRGEFMRATRILTQRPDRAVLALAELCRERDDDLYRAPRSESPIPVPPRAMSTNRSVYSTLPTNGGMPGHPGWRSQSQAASFDRIGGPSHLETPHIPDRRGRHSDAEEFTGQDLWLASQGSNLGNLGMGYSTSDSPFDPSRGRDTVQRGLETPGGYNRTPRRSGSGYDDHPAAAGSGSISAPLSPHAMYAKLELGKPHHHPGWPTSGSGSNASGSGTATGNFAPPTSSIPVPPQHQHGRTYKTPTTSRSGSLIPGPGPGWAGGPYSSALENYPHTMNHGYNYSNPHTYSHVGLNHQQQHQQYNKSQITDQVAPLPPFQPFSPPQVPNILRELNGEPASYISPSTLLSPPSERKELGMEEVTKSLEGLGVETGTVGAGEEGGVEERERGKGKQTQKEGEVEGEVDETPEDIEAGIGLGPVDGDGKKRST